MHTVIDLTWEKTKNSSQKETKTSVKRAPSSKVPFNFAKKWG